MEPSFSKTLSFVPGAKASILENFASDSSLMRRSSTSCRCISPKSEILANASSLH